MMWVQSDTVQRASSLPRGLPALKSAIWIHTLKLPISDYMRLFVFIFSIFGGFVFRFKEVYQCKEGKVLQSSFKIFIVLLLLGLTLQQNDSQRKKMFHAILALDRM